MLRIIFLTLFYINLSYGIILDEYLKQYIISYAISNIIKEITPGQKELNTQYKDYYFNNIFFGDL